MDTSLGKTWLSYGDQLELLVRRGMQVEDPSRAEKLLSYVSYGLRVKMCVWLGVSRGLDLAFLNAD